MWYPRKARRKVKAVTRRKAEHILRLADEAGRFAVDALLRARGFTVLERRGKLAAVWTRNGKRFPQWQALRTIPPEEVEKARLAERAWKERRQGECEGR